MRNTLTPLIASLLLTAPGFAGDLEWVRVSGRSFVLEKTVGCVKQSADPPIG